MIHVLIVDDHTITRVGIKFFIEQDPDIRVIAEACNGEDAIALCASIDADIVLMDLNMPKLSGVEAIKNIISNKPDTRILVLTGCSSKREIKEALNAGAKGYCLKDINYTPLIEAIKCIAADETWIDPSVFGAFLEQSYLISGGQNNLTSNSYNLSLRELQVLSLVVEGKTNQEIAIHLGLSIDTAKNHLRGIMDKLFVTDRTQAAVKAVREKLI